MLFVRLCTDVTVKHITTILFLLLTDIKMSEDTKKSAKKKPHRRMKAVYTKIREQVSRLYSIS